MRKKYVRSEIVEAEQWLDPYKPLGGMNFIADEVVDIQLTQVKSPIYLVDTLADDAVPIKVTDWIVYDDTADLGPLAVIDDYEFKRKFMEYNPS